MFSSKHCSWDTFRLHFDWLEERLEYYERAAWQPASSLNVEQLAGNVAMGSQIYLLLPSNRNRVHAQGVKAGHFWADGNISRQLQINVPVLGSPKRKGRPILVGSKYRKLNVRRKEGGGGRELKEVYSPVFQLDHSFENAWNSWDEVQSTSRCL